MRGLANCKEHVRDLSALNQNKQHRSFQLHVKMVSRQEAKNIQTKRACNLIRDKSGNLDASKHYASMLAAGRENNRHLTCHKTPAVRRMHDAIAVDC
jgi:hypothetical protein